MAPPSKKRKISVTAPEKIEFDPSAREEYLTGFHKRKVARQKFAQEEAAKREKEEKLRFRREVRLLTTLHSNWQRVIANPLNSSANSAKSISRNTSKK